MITPVACIIGLLFFLAMMVVAIKKKNRAAAFLLVPYVALLSWGVAHNLSALRGTKPKEILLGDMQRLEKIEIGDVFSIVFSSDVVFGDGQKCAGGLIRNPEDHRDISAFLASRDLSIGNENALIWLKDSKSSKVIVGPQVMYLPDQARAEAGIWISLIPKGDVKRVQRMDGANLP